MDLTTITFPALACIGVVNVITFFKPELDSKIKFAVSILVALALSFIPPELTNVLLIKTLEAVEIAFVASGGYKIAQKIGGQ